MPDFLTILTRWWKAILGLTALAALAAGLVLVLTPGLYLSTVTALPANSVAADKGSIFNRNVQQLYPAIGSPDELDRVIGTASLDTLYRALVEKYDLSRHYNVNDKPNGVDRAVQKLKKYSSVQKSEYGELKIKVWDTNPQLAAALANHFFGLLQEFHQQLQNRGNATVLHRLQENYQKLRSGFPAAAGDSAARPAEGALAALSGAGNKLALFNEYERLIAEYSLLLESRPPVLLMVEGARPGYYIDRPRRWAVLAVATFGGFLFGLLVALFLERRTQP